MAIHHELQTVRAHCEPLDDTIHRQAHPTQSSNVPIRHTIIHNKIRKFWIQFGMKRKLPRKTHCDSYVISGAPDHLHFCFGEFPEIAFAVCFLFLFFFYLFFFVSRRFLKLKF